MPDKQKLTAFIGKEAVKTTVKAEETKLKGYSKFRFFCFKAEKHWHVCEWMSGREVSEGYNTTLAAAKKSAREYIAKNIEGDLSKLKKAIESFKTVNTK